MKKLRIGIVGTGFIAPFHYNGFRECAQAQVVGITTHSSKDKVKKLCSDWGIKAFDSFEQMVSSPEVDAIVLGSMNTEHFAQLLLAQKHGKPVLAEKPVVTDLKQLDVLADSVARTGVPIMPGHNFVYRGAVQAARKAVKSGALGRIVYASFSSNHTISEEHSHGWRSKLKLGAGGALMDSGHHQVYQSLYLLGKPVALHGFKSRLVLTHMEGEDVGHVQMQYADGTIGCILQTWTNNKGGAVDGIRIVGTEASLEVTDALYVNGKKIDSDTDYCKSFANQAQAFVDLVLARKAPESTLTDARNALEMIQLAYRSADDGKVATLTP